MPAPLPTPRVPLGFPPLAVAGGQTAHLGGPTVPKTEVGGQTTSPGGQTAPCAEAHGQTATLGGSTARTHVIPSSPTSPSSATSRAAPTTSATPNAAPSTPPLTPAAPPVALEPYPLHYSRHHRAAQEPPSPPLHQQSAPVKAVPVAPPINPHLMITWVKRGFQLSADKLTLSATSTSIVSPVPSFVRVILVDLNWHRAMEEEFATLIANNT
jgi:hypothetical protein